MSNLMSRLTQWERKCLTGVCKVPHVSLTSFSATHHTPVTQAILANCSITGPCTCNTASVQRPLSLHIHMGRIFFFRSLLICHLTDYFPDHSPDHIWNCRLRFSSIALCPSSVLYFSLELCHHVIYYIFYLYCCGSCLFNIFCIFPRSIFVNN